jgi:hypothetical protein
MSRHLPIALSALLIALFPAAALAAQRTINIPTSSIAPSGVANNNGTSLLTLSAGLSGGFISFVLPRDYKSGTVVRLRLSMFTSTATPCTVFLFPAQAIRTRIGQHTYNSTERFTIVGGPLVTSPVGFMALSKTFELRKPLAAPFTGQVAGDGILLEIVRDGDQVTDTCGNVFINHAEVRYTRK